MTGKSVAGFLAAAAIAATAAVAGAAGPGGGGVGAGIGAGGMSGIGNVGAFGFSLSGISANHLPSVGPHAFSKGGSGAVGVMGGSMSNGLQFPFPTNEPEHYHEIKLVGSVVPDDLGLTIDAQIVRLRVNDQTIPMTINSGVVSEALQFDQGDEQGQMLYRTIMSKRLVVVGEEGLRAKITKAAAAEPGNSRALIVDGYVYDRATPYLVLRSVDDAP